MRIVGGRFGGRIVPAPADKAIRPTAERTREALFDILAHGAAFRSRALPEGADVVDAFAGTGALGFEAISRGAARVAFVERNARAVRSIRETARALGLEDEVAILARDATRPGRPPWPADLVLLDAPYGQDLTAPALIALRREGWLKPEAVAVVELARRESLTAIPSFDVVDERTYGAARLIFLRVGKSD